MRRFESYHPSHCLLFKLGNFLSWDGSTEPESANEFAVIAGSHSVHLAQGIADELQVKPAHITVDRFSDGEIMVEINENMRGRDVFVVQSTSSPGAESLFELALILDALRRASAGAITAVIPYFGYSRQDRRPRSQRVPISSKVAADLISSTGAARVLSARFALGTVAGLLYHSCRQRLLHAYVFRRHHAAHSHKRKRRKDHSGIA